MFDVRRVGTSCCIATPTHISLRAAAASWKEQTIKTLSEKGERQKSMIKIGRDAAIANEQGFPICYGLNSSSFLCSCHTWMRGGKKIYHKTTKEPNRRWIKTEMKMASMMFLLNVSRRGFVSGGFILFHFMDLQTLIDSSKIFVTTRISQKNTKWLMIEMREPQLETYRSIYGFSFN